MDATKRSLGKIFSPPGRLMAPLFQRPYVWERRANWIPLWDAVQEAAKRRESRQKPRPYFLGAIVVEQLPNSIGTVETREIIDGQQRLTTLQVLLAAVRDIASV